MKTKTHFAFRVDVWDDAGNSIVEHVAGVDDFEVAEATYRAAVARWPAARITLRQGIRVVHDTKKGVRHAEATIETNIGRFHSGSKAQGDRRVRARRHVFFQRTEAHQ
jgi:hypothetical protein